MNDTELLKLDCFMAERVMKWPLTFEPYYARTKPGYCVADNGEVWSGVGGFKRFSPTTDPAAAMQALMKYFELDPNDCLPALHNFLCKKQFSERTLTPEKICLFIKWHYQKYHQP